MTPLRQRFSDDLRLRNKSPRTIEAYVHAVAKFARHFNKSPELLGPDQIRQYQLHLIEQKVSWSQFNQGVCALRFLYNVTLKRPHLVEHLPFAKRPRLLPSVLTRDEVARLLTAAQPGRDRMLLETAYSCGLRLQELLGLQVRDVDGARMVLHVRHAKGSRDRLVPLSTTLLVQLRAYWQEYHPTTYLFPGLKPGTAYGLLANRFREARLQASRRLLLVEVIAEAVQQSSAEPVEVKPPKERCCEQCGSRRLECVPLPKSRNTS